MLVIEKKINSRFCYYWNEIYCRWEGLINNASSIKDSQVDFWERKIKNNRIFIGAKINSL